MVEGITREYFFIVLLLVFASCSETTSSGGAAGLFGPVRGNDVLIRDVVLVDPNVKAEVTQCVRVGALVGWNQASPSEVEDAI